MEKDITNEEFERIKKHIDDYSYLDLIIWRNQMIEIGKVNNRLFNLIDMEIKQRKEKNDSKKSK